MSVHQFSGLSRLDSRTISFDVAVLSTIAIAAAAFYDNWAREIITPATR